MNNKFLSRFDAENITKTITYFVIAGLLISISLVVGISDNILMIAMLLIGMVLFLYAMLRPWGKASYYAIMGGIFLILLIFEILGVKMDLKVPLYEDILFFSVFIIVAGIIAGIIGIFRFRKYD